MIYLGLIEVIHTHTPQVLSLEKAFLAYNVQSALRLGEARGVALLAAAQAGLAGMVELDRLCFAVFGVALLITGTMVTFCPYKKRRV